MLPKNPTNHLHTEHIDIENHFISKKLKERKTCLRCCPTVNIITYMITKILAKDKYQGLTKAMGFQTFDY
jgi:hypothetical protein